MGLSKRLRQGSTALSIVAILVGTVVPGWAVVDNQFDDIGFFIPEFARIASKISNANREFCDVIGRSIENVPIVNAPPKIQELFILTNGHQFISRQSRAMALHGTLRSYEIRRQIGQDFEIEVARQIYILEILGNIEPCTPGRGGSGIEPVKMKRPPHRPVGGSVRKISHSLEGHERALQLSQRLFGNIGGPVSATSSIARRNPEQNCREGENDCENRYNFLVAMVKDGN